MSVFLNYLKAVTRTSAPRRKGLTPEVHAEAVKAWRRMRDGRTSPIDNVYLHVSSMLGTSDMEVLMVLHASTAVDMDDVLPALHYLETLSDLDVLHIDQVNIVERLILKQASRDRTMALNLRNQTSNAIMAFKELREKVRSLEAVEIDLLSRHESPDKLKYAEQIMSYFALGDRSFAQRKAAQVCYKVLLDDFNQALANANSDS